MKTSLDIMAEHGQRKRKVAECTADNQSPCKKSRRSYVEDNLPFQLGSIYRKSDIDEHYSGLKNDHMSLAFNSPIIIIFARSSNPQLNDGLKREDNRFVFTSIIKEGDLEALAIRAAVKEHKKREKRITLFSKLFHNGHVRFLGELVYESHMTVFIEDGLTKGIEFTFGIRSWYKRSSREIPPSIASESLPSRTINRTNSNSSLSTSSDSVSQSSPLSLSEEIAAEYSVLESPLGTHLDHEMSISSVNSDGAAISQLSAVPLLSVEQQLQCHPLEFYDELSFNSYLHGSDEDNAHWPLSYNMDLDSFSEFSDFFA